MSMIYPWQTPLWQGLVSRQQQQRLPHALLLYGAEGMGKNHFAREFARYLLCEHQNESGEPCGQCRGCLLYAAGNHPDMTTVQPEELGKTITIDMIRKLSSSLGMSSQYGGYKVVIVTPAEQMNVASANSLLKTLEEPTPNTILILVCAKIDRLLPTIRSRCQKILMDHPPRDVAMAWLKEQSQDGVKNAELLLTLARNAPLLANKLANTEILAQRAELIGVLDKLATGKSNPVEAANTTIGFELKNIIHWLTGWIMDMIRYKFSATPVHNDAPDVVEQLRRYSAQIDLHKLYGYFDQLVESSRLAGTQVNDQLLLEESLMGWMRLFSTRSKRS